LFLARKARQEIERTNSVEDAGLGGLIVAGQKLIARGKKGSGNQDKTGRNEIAKTSRLARSMPSRQYANIRQSYRLY
jgi:hypothetical protein